MQEEQTEAAFQMEALRYEFEKALERCREPEAFDCLKSLAQTMGQIPADVFAVYAELFEDIPDFELHQDLLHQVRIGWWLPKTATEFVECYISQSTGTKKRGRPTAGRV